MDVNDKLKVINYLYVKNENEIKKNYNNSMINHDNLKNYYKDINNDFDNLKKNIKN